MTITIPVKYEADTSDLTKELDKAAGAGSKVGKSFKSALLPAAAGLAALTAGAFKFANAAADDAKAQTLLASALKNNAGASAAQIAANEDFISSLSKSAAVADDELRPALANLVRGTGDVGQAQAALKTALDISAATGKPLATVSAALAKGYGGQATALGRLVPGLDKTAIAAGDMTAIMAQLADKTGGAAAEAANSTAGQMAGMTIAMDEAQETIGTALLPVLSFLASTLASVATFVQENSNLVLILGGVLGGLAVAVIAVNAAMTAYAAITKAVTVAQKLLNLTLAVNPIALVVIAVVALAAALVIAYKKSQTFRNIVNGVFNSVAAVAKAVFGAIQTAATFVWDVLKVGVKAVSVAFSLYFGAIKAVVTTVFGAITDVVSTFVGFAKTAASKIGGFFSGIWTGIAEAAKAAFGGVIGIVNQAIAGINTVIDGLNKIPKVNIPHIPEIPGFASGTGFAPGGLALVGERGPELVNLPRGSQVTPADQTARALGGETNIEVNQNFFGPTTSSGRLRELEWTLRFATGRGRVA